MQKIDAHQHFWHYDPVKEAWISSSMLAIRRDFLPGDLLPLLNEHQIEGCIAVQADQSAAETHFLLELAQTNPFIMGVVGWIELQADNIEEQLQVYARQRLIKGFRHILQAEPDDFMLSDKFMRGIALLDKFNYTYDIVIHAGQLPKAEKLASAFPQQRFVIDHLAKPKIKNGEMAAWKSGIMAIARLPNVYCKISGFGVEADWNNWQTRDVRPYFDVVFGAFGTDRVMFGSDWPVSLLAGGYAKALNCLEAYTADFSAAEKVNFWAGNARRFYNL